MTKIELWTKHWANSDAKERGERYYYPYDKGSILLNLRDFFGTSFSTPFESGTPSGFSHEKVQKYGASLMEFL